MGSGAPNPKRTGLGFPKRPSGLMFRPQSGGWGNIFEMSFPKPFLKWPLLEHSEHRGFDAEGTCILLPLSLVTYSVWLIILPLYENGGRAMRFLVPFGDEESSSHFQSLNVVSVCPPRPPHPHTGLEAGPSPCSPIPSLAVWQVRRSLSSRRKQSWLLSLSPAWCISPPCTV